MIEDIIKSLEQFQEFFTNKFDQQPEEAIEILLMLAYGHIFEIFTPNQLAETLGIGKNSESYLIIPRQSFWLKNLGKHHR